MFHNRSGFTLIELLIVVAIIAILAAIAVPNFLEAQTRSKVSRVKSDMRTVATALEAYAVDANRYPLTLNDNDQVMHMMGNMRMAFVPISVTTPVAFISEVPLDTFNPRIMQMNGITHRHSFIYINSFNTDPTLIADYQGQVEERPVETAPQWAMYSTGPDGEYSAMQMIMGTNDPPTYGLMYNPVTSPVQYDPTNGTVSHGDVVRFQGN